MPKQVEKGGGGGGEGFYNLLHLFLFRNKNNRTLPEFSFQTF